MERRNGAGTWLLLLFSVSVAATAVVMIKAAGTHPYFLAAVRLLGSAAVLSPFYFRELAARRARGLGPRTHAEAFRVVLAPSAIIALHFLSWTVGARMTTAGNSSLIVNMNPVAMPFAAYLLSGIRPTRRELAATGIAVAGVLVMGAGDFRLSTDHFIGDLVCLFSMLGFTGYLAFSRRINTDGRLMTYLVPLYAAGGLLCLAAAAAMPGAIALPSARDALLLAALVLGPTVLGHSVLNWAMTRMRPQTVAIVNLFQFAVAGALGFVFFLEIPTFRFYLTVALILAGAFLAITAPTARR